MRPRRGSTWSGSMQARRFTKGQWLRRRPRAGNGFALHRMERACGTASTGSSGKREKPGGCPIKTDSGQKRTDGSSQPPEALGICPGGPTFTGAEAAIFRDLGLFLAMANKCLELGYFPRAWKVAAIKVIPKPGKEDYARPKSYRPIGLLPCWAKQWKGCWSAASSGT
ncbi:Probable RNA-directed DNA polymerase from transposon X-element [Eumeta japonica]|uniref:Probable RNA-directed DNA polymerase from transposon X-element n=1 Tax=Eumeta variegata TaxID=151549 RepID=A0A4C1S7S9_EUMVA|nr:Probable RNA-directed DNA polymerase from transposon X-element [Eumeta japonica]